MQFELNICVLNRDAACVIPRKKTGAKSVDLAPGKEEGNLLFLSKKGYNITPARVDAAITNSREWNLDTRQ